MSNAVRALIADAINVRVVVAIASRARLLRVRLAFSARCLTCLWGISIITSFRPSLRVARAFSGSAYHPEVRDGGMMGDSIQHGGTAKLPHATMEHMPVRPLWVEESPPLVAELWIARTRSIKDLRNDPYDPIPELIRMAENIFRIPRTKHKKEKVFAVLTATLTFLESDEQRRATQRLFDLSLTGSYKPLRLRHETAAAEIDPTRVNPISRETFTDNRAKGRQYEQNLILAVADVLRNIHRHLGEVRPQLRPRTRRPIDASKAIWPYLPRPELEEQFAQAVLGGYPIILFVGDKGVGKSRLAHELCLRHAQNDVHQVVVIRFSGHDELDEIAIGSALRERGLDPGKYGLRTARFADMLASDYAPRFTILDGMTDYTTVNSLILPGLRTTLVVTGAQSANGAYIISVPPMTDIQSRELVRSMLINATTDEIGQVISAADNRPGLIEHFCRLLASRVFESAEMLARNIKADPELFFELAEPAWRERLTTYYSHMLESLHSRYPTAALVLELLSLHSWEYCNRNSLERVLGKLLTISDESYLAEVFNEALFRLQSNSLVTDDTKRGRIHLNSLTRIILSEYLSDRKEVIFDRLHVVIDDGLKDASARRDAYSFDLWKALWYAFNPVRLVFDYDTRDYSELERYPKWASFPSYPDPTRMEFTAPIAQLPGDESQSIPGEFHLIIFADMAQLLFEDIEAANLALANGAHSQGSANG